MTNFVMFVSGLSWAATCARASIPLIPAWKAHWFPMFLIRNTSVTNVYKIIFIILVWPMRLWRIDRPRVLPTCYQCSYFSHWTPEDDVAVRIRVSGHHLVDNFLPCVCIEPVLASVRLVWIVLKQEQSGCPSWDLTQAICIWKHSSFRRHHVTW